MTKEPLLFLCHRIPFPPNKGDKITTFNLLKFLSKRYRVYLGCFIDDEFDRQYINALDAYCEEYFCLDICGRKQAISGIRALIFGTPVSTEHYRSTEFQSWVDNTVRQKSINKLFVYSSGMVQFVNHDRYADKTRLLDMADVDSDKWRQYAENKPWHTRWIYAREQKILSELEQNALIKFEAVTLITDEEADLFRSLSPTEHRDAIFTLSNGVDTDYFNPDAEFDLSNLPALHSPSICFTGAMDYWANVDAVVWFCHQVWPVIQKQISNCRFYVVGSNPPPKIKQLESDPNITVTGRVADVRPYLAAAGVVVAPMRIARGVQNKVLEAMAMAKPVVMTSMGQEGISLDSSQQALVLDEPEAMAECIISLLRSDHLDYAYNRQWIVERYSWDGALAKLPDLLNLKKK